MHERTAHVNLGTDEVSLDCSVLVWIPFRSDWEVEPVEPNVNVKEMGSIRKYQTLGFA